jgi:hypothetical protein
MVSSSNSADIGVKAVIISTTTGLPLVTLKLDALIDENTLIPFLSSVKTLSNTVIGKEAEMHLNSGGHNIYCFHKQYDGLELMVFALMSSDLKKIQIRDEAESALDSFVQYYGIYHLKKWDGDVNLFKDFEAMLQQQVQEYYSKVQSGEESMKKGFLARLFRRKKQ